MDQFSGIRAKARRKRERRRIAVTARIAPLLGLLGLLLVTTAPEVRASGGHGAEEPKPAEAPAPPPPPPPPPRVIPPPPKLDGPVAAPQPRARLRFLADATTGLALGGFDPVAYFVDGRPSPGSSEQEYDWSGTTWRFVNAGNLGAFRQSPEVYAPSFGGRCAFAVARGWPTEASPQYFLLHRGRLLLFADPTARTAFAMDPDRLLAEADRRWPALLNDLP